jgi:predicted O-linked N-acetylglucosamine transferase (SPINDLY family)
MNSLEYLAFVHTADLLAKTFGFAGSNSTFEVLSTETPVLAYASKHMRARVTMGMLSTIGLGDCADTDQESFVSIALELANDITKSWRGPVPCPRRPSLFERKSAAVSLSALLEPTADASRTGDWLKLGVLSVH